MEGGSDRLDDGGDGWTVWCVISMEYFLRQRIEADG